MNLQASIRIPRRAKDGIDGHTFSAYLTVIAPIEDGNLSSPKLGFDFMYDGEVVSVPEENIRVRHTDTDGNWYSWQEVSENRDLTNTGGVWDITDIGYNNGCTFQLGAEYKGFTAYDSVFIPNSKTGERGIPGQIPIQKEWVVGDVHRNTDEIVDYIYVRGADKNTSYWYKLASKGTKLDVGAPPSHGTIPPGYERIDWLKELAVQVLIAEEANVAGFIFKEGRLISVRGTVGGVDADYSGQAGFVPNLILDGTEGDVKITGTVNATSGVFTGALASPFERTKSTYTKDFSNNLIVTGGTFILPWDQLGSGRLIRLIQPHPGTPYCTAPTGKYFYEDGEQKNTLTMLGAEIIELLGYTDGHGNFTGWLVLNRGLLHTASTWGEPHRIVAHGHVKTNSPFKYHAFDGSTLTISTSEFNSRKYTSIIMPEKWFDRIDGYYVKIIANGGDSAAFHTVVKNTHYAFAVYQHSLNVANGTLSPTTTFDFYFEVYSAAWLYPKTGAVELPGVAW